FRYISIAPRSSETVRDLSANTWNLSRWVPNVPASFVYVAYACFGNYTRQSANKTFDVLKSWFNYNVSTFIYEAPAVVYCYARHPIKKILSKIKLWADYTCPAFIDKAILPADLPSR